MGWLNVLEWGWRLLREASRVIEVLLERWSGRRHGPDDRRWRRRHARPSSVSVAWYLHIVYGDRVVVSQECGRSRGIEELRNERPLPW